MVSAAEQERGHCMGWKREQHNDCGSSGHGRAPPVPPAGDEGTDHDGDRDHNSWFPMHEAGPQAIDTHCQRVEERVGCPE